MKAIVHIGMGKTGTSTIQRFLQANQKPLADQGILHRNYNKSGSPANSELVVASMTRVDRVEKISPRLVRNTYGYGVSEATIKSDAARIEAEIRADSQKDQFHTQVFSAEHLSANLSTRKDVESLHGVLTELYDDVEYVVYIRSQEDRAASWYSQTRRAGAANSFEDHVDGWSDYSYRELFGLWSRVVGVDKFSIRLFDRSMMVNNDLIDDFCDFAGIDPTALSRIEPANEALSFEMAELMRAVNARLADQNLDEPVAYPLRRHAAEAMNSVGGAGGKVQLTAEQIVNIRKANRKDNNAIRRQFFPDREHLFANKPVAEIARNLPPPTTISIEEAADVIFKLLMRVKNEADDKAETVSEGS